MILAIVTAILLLTGCQREDARCVEVCTTMANVCAAAAAARPFVPPEQTVESCRMCMESYALCRRGCEVQP